MPPILTLRDIAHHADRAPLFEGVELALEPGDRFCLIGRNGCGKSTLLRILASRIDADRGERFLQPGTRVGLLSQEVLDDVDGTVVDWATGDLGDEAAHHRAEAFLDRLGLDGSRPMAELSGGEQRRAHLARVLAAEPDILLLDEPTNHLDIDAIRWLEDFIAGWRGAAVIVSHDRAFLRRVTTAMIWLDRGMLRRRDARFETFEAWAGEVAEADRKNAARVARRISEEERYMERGVTARRTRNQRRVAELASLRRERAELRRSVQGSVAIGLEAGSSRSNLVIEASGIAKSYDGRTIIAPFDARILRRDRVGIVGPNGSGKTTLIRMLTGDLAPDGGEVRHAPDGGEVRHAPDGGEVRHAPDLSIVTFDQRRQQLDPDSTPWKTLASGNSDRVLVRGESRHVVAYLRDFLFAENQARQPIRTLSGGERNRLLLARLFTQPADLLVLDEPTNDLDMETLDLLQDVLSDFPGTLIVVSHDRDFLDRLVTQTYGMEPGGRIVEAPGGYTDYIRQRERSGAQVKSAAAVKEQPKPEAAKQEKSKARTRLSYKDQRELDMLPDRIAGLETEIARLETELADPDLFTRDPDAYKAAATGLEKAQTDLAMAEERWLELEEMKESLAS